jgi:outer membrane protein assembly factor BamB
MNRSRVNGYSATLCVAGLVTAVAIARSAQAENWPRFRGPNGTGITHEKGFPVTWTDQDYLWKTRLPGLGHSSPCVWDDHVFLTSAEDEGRQRLLLDLSASTGEIRWVWRMPSETHAIHLLSSYASATPATDGQRVYVPFSTESEYCLFALDFSGKPLWKANLGPFISQHGSGVSPIVFEDLVILGNDQDGPSSIVAIDSETGEVRWRNSRNDKQLPQATAYATPILVDNSQGDIELILTSRGDGFTSYDPRTGRLNWRADIIPDRTVASPVFGHGMIFATSGGGGEGKFLAAIRLGGNGELGHTQVAWTRTRQLPYVPTPILYGDHLYLWGDSGVVSCVVAKTGQNVWTQRVQGKYSGSPICVDGKLYCTTQEGEVVVIAASPNFQLLGRNRLGEASHGTPAVSNGRMFLRGFEHLFCLEAKRKG